MVSNDRLTIAVVSYNSAEVISRCMDDLMRGVEFPVIIVDNASSDASAEKLATRYPNVRVIRSERNLGYGRAANLAFAKATTPYVLLLNPDLYATEEAIRKLLSDAIALAPEAVLVAPAVAEKDYMRKGLVDKDWVIGAAMMFNVEQLKMVGYFDENIFLFAEETDLCFRIRQAGMRIVLDTDVFMAHLYRQSSAPDPRIEDLKNWHFAWSRAYYYTKHGLAVGKKHPLRLAARYFSKYLLAFKSEKRALYKARMRGALAFIRGEKAFLPDGTPQCLPVHPKRT